jgi:hypothetical protein
MSSVQVLREFGMVSEEAGAGGGDAECVEG